jgi:hypothetical protein
MEPWQRELVDTVTEIVLDRTKTTAAIRSLLVFTVHALHRADVIDGDNIVEMLRKQADLPESLAADALRELADSLERMLAGPQPPTFSVVPGGLTDGE